MKLPCRIRLAARFADRRWVKRGGTEGEIGRLAVWAVPAGVIGTNRDQRHYADPDRFDVTRSPTDQLAFGRGIHLCAGMNLAKLEAHTLLSVMAREIERFEASGRRRTAYRPWRKLRPDVIRR